jgi:hypothetical protein
MQATVDELESAALQLEPIERAELIRRLVPTLEPSTTFASEEEWVAFWSAEAERRDQEIESGAVTPLDGETVLKRWQERYQ